MSEFLFWNPPLTLWPLVYFLFGAVVAVAWSAQFRRLRRAAVSADDLLWEARRAALFGFSWLGFLALLFLVIHTSNLISAVEAASVCDQFGGMMDFFHKYVAITRTPALVTLGLAVMMLAVCGLLSGVFQVLGEGAPGREASRVS